MQLTLSRQDLETIDSLLDEGILQDIAWDQFDRQNGVVLFACGDGDQFHDRYAYQSRIQMSHRDDHPRIHVIAVNGGPLVCHLRSPIVTRNSTLSEDILNMLIDSARMKNMEAIILEGHAPCGAAQKAGLSLYYQLKTQWEASMYVRDRIRNRIDRPNLGIVDHLHVSYAGRKRTYAIDEQKLIKWLPVYGKHLFAA